MKMRIQLKDVYGEKPYLAVEMGTYPTQVSFGVPLKKVEDGNELEPTFEIDVK